MYRLFVFINLEININDNSNNYNNNNNDKNDECSHRCHYGNISMPQVDFHTLILF